jgi:hypothetical protein
METWMLGLSGALALVLVACGGKVVIDAGDGSGGAGGSSGSSSSTGTGMGGGDPQSLCDKACEKMNTVPGCAQPECASLCFTEYQKSGPCQSLFLDVTTCIAENAGIGGSCTGQPCDGVLQDYEACLNGSTSSCETGLCSSGSDGSCSCSGKCNGSSVSAACFPSADGALTCVCNVGGMDVGKCEPPGGSGFPCDITGGCCAAYFF